MSDELVDIFTPEPCHVEPARERVALDPGSKFIATRQAVERRARQRFKATLAMIGQLTASSQAIPTPKSAEKVITKSTNSRDPTLLQLPIKDRRRRKCQARSKLPTGSASIVKPIGRRFAASRSLSSAGGL